MVAPKPHWALAGIADTLQPPGLSEDEADRWEQGPMNGIDLETLLSYAALGLIVGFGYYLALNMNGRLVAGGAPRWVVIGIQILQLLAAIGFFAWLASLGMTPILAAFAGFLVGRVIALQLIGADA